MATATKARKKKQKRIPGTEEERIKEIDDAADDYVECRDKRMGLTEKEKEAKNRLIDVMKRHKLSVYKGDGFVVTYDHEEKDDVKVKQAKAEANGDDHEEEEGEDAE